MSWLKWIITYSWFFFSIPAFIFTFWLLWFKMWTLWFKFSNTQIFLLKIKYINSTINSSNFQSSYTLIYFLFVFLDNFYVILFLCKYTIIKKNQNFNNNRFNICTTFASLNKEKQYILHALVISGFIRFFYQVSSALGH